MAGPGWAGTQRPMPKEITRILAKQRRKEPLTPEEEAFKREYYRPYKKDRCTICATEKEIAEWEAEAQTKGTRLSPHLLHLIRIGRGGNQAELAALRRQLQTSEDQKAALTQSMGSLAEK